MSLYLGIDYGLRHVGLAIGEPGSTAVPSETLEGLSHQTLLDRLQTIVHEKGIERVIVGLPLSMDGGESDQTTATRKFIESLKSSISVPVETVDERLTSKAAGDHAGAAALILQTALDRP